MEDQVNIYNLYKYSDNIFSKISNVQIVTYFIILLIIIFIVQTTNNFSYVFISICLFSIFIYYSQSLSYANNILKTNKMKSYLEELSINKNSFIARDEYLVELLFEARFIKLKAKKKYVFLIKRIEYFFVIFETLKQGINNIYLSPTDMIKPLELTNPQSSILINDLRDQLELILKYTQTIIHVLPHDLRYLDSFYNFYQLLRSHLSKYYNKILSDYNYSDHTSKYLLIRSSEDKYGFLDQFNKD